MTYDSDVAANSLFNSLISGVDFSIPEVNLDDPIFDVPGGTDSDIYKAIKALTNEDLTTREVNGDGTLDALLESMKSHLKEEQKANRITGAEYTKAYVAMFQTCISGAVQYLLGRDQAYWQAQLAQIQAITGRIQLQTAKVQLAALQLEALNQQATYAINKIRLANEDAQYGQIKYNVDEIMPLQKAGMTTENSISTYRLSNILPAEKEGLEAQNDIAAYQLTSIMPKQATGLETQNSIGSFQLSQLLPQQLTLTKEQTEAQRAQTLDNRTDGSAVTGSIGKQKDLYTQQITSYKRDAEIKFAKMYSDAFITQKTIDEGLTPPDNFTSTGIDTLFNQIRINVISG